MSNSQVCRKFLEGRCRGKCNYMHPTSSTPKPIQHTTKKQVSTPMIHHQKIIEFNATDFNTYLYKTLPDGLSSSLTQVYMEISGTDFSTAINEVNKMPDLMVDISTLLMTGLTNNNWLKDIHTRFIPDYQNSNDFNENSMKMVLTFIVVNIYKQRYTTELYKYVAFYMCLMKIYSALSIPIQIHDTLVIESNQELFTD